MFLYRNYQYAIHRHNDYGPIFGRGPQDFLIYNNCHTNTNSYSNLGHSYRPPNGYSYGSSQAKNLLAGSHTFKCDEYEVFYQVWIEITFGIRSLTAKLRGPRRNKAVESGQDLECVKCNLTQSGGTNCTNKNWQWICWVISVLSFSNLTKLFHFNDKKRNNKFLNLQLWTQLRRCLVIFLLYVPLYAIQSSAKQNNLIGCWTLRKLTIGIFRDMGSRTWEKLARGPGSPYLRPSSHLGATPGGHQCEHEFFF